MTTNLSVTNLKYEEVVLLQEILIKVSLDGSYENNPEDMEVFESLYEKVMSS